MPWLSILKGLIGVVNAIAKYLSDKQLIDAGEARAVSKSLQETIKTIRRADRAADNIDDSADGVLQDPNNRAANDD